MLALPGRVLRGRLAAVALAVAAAAALTPPAAPAAAACPVFNIVRAAVANGAVPPRYSVPCLHKALSAVASDPDLIYTQAEQAIRIAIARGPSGPTAVAGGTTTSAAPVAAGPGGDASVPAPVIALGVVAVVAVAGAGVVELRRRRRA